MDAYVGEIRCFSFSYIPQGWLPCYGQIIKVMEYQALFSLMANTFGGNYSQGTFALPNLQGQAFIGNGQGPGLTSRQMGKSYGETTETLTSLAQIGSHTHAANVVQPKNANLTTNGQTAPVANLSWLSQVGNVPDATHFRSAKAYFPATTPPTLDSQFTGQTIGPACGNSNGSVSPHGNMQPYLPFLVCICYMGEYPVYN